MQTTTGSAKPPQCKGSSNSGGGAGTVDGASLPSDDGAGDFDPEFGGECGVLVVVVLLVVVVVVIVVVVGEGGGTPTAAGG